MIIQKTDFVEGAQNAQGIVVIIDVFRAFSVACYSMERGAKNIIPVGEVENAQALAELIDNSVLVGERKGKKLRGFDYGNSPTEILTADLTGKTIVHTTHAGTQGLVNATQADEILTGAFVNAKAIADYIKQKNPDTVTLVRMGLEATQNSDEDDLCADYIENLLNDEPVNETDIVNALTASPFSRRFFDREIPWNPESDFHLCLDFNRFNFVLRANIDKGRLAGLEQIFTDA